jgi:hypothetical protein
LSLEQLTRLGAEVFDRQVRPCLRPEDEGRFVALDIESGEYEVADDDAAVERLRLRLPEAEVWLERAGHPTAYQIRLGR